MRSAVTCCLAPAASTSAAHVAPASCTPASEMIERLIPDHPDHHGADWTTPTDYVLQPSARRFESWEFSHGGWLGLGNAVDEALAIGTDRIEATIYERADSLRKRASCGWLHGVGSWRTSLRHRDRNR